MIAGLLLGAVGLLAGGGMGYMMGKGATVSTVKAELLKLEGEAVADAKAVIARIKALF